MNEKQPQKLLRKLLILALAMLSMAGVSLAAEPTSTGQRIVAFADVHGAYPELESLLLQLGVINTEKKWSGGNVRLVSLGDLLDRGPRTREVLDLLIRLETEASAAGGQFILVLGNHEVMNLTGELDYVSDADIAEFAGDETVVQRQAAFAHYAGRPEMVGLDPALLRAQFDEIYPPGYFARLEAFSPEGQYGGWLLQKPVVITLDRTLFVHGGLAPVMGELPGDLLNQQIADQIRSYADAWYYLVRAGALPPELDVNERIELARQLQVDPAVDPVTQSAATQLIEASDSVALGADSPYWYRGSVYCNPLIESNLIENALREQNADQAVVGHTPTATHRVESVANGQIIMLDTGMLESVYQGDASALIIDQGEMSVIYSGTKKAVKITPRARKVGARPDDLSDDDLEQILLTGDIVAIEEIPEGVTDPQKVTVEKDGIQISAVFKTLETELRKGRGPDRNRSINNSDRWQYEIAAYRLDRLLGLDMVPVAVERKIGGKNGALIYWMPGLLSLLDKNQQGIAAEGWCPLQPQHDLMYVWDTLIYNDDRTLQNVAYTTPDWTLRLIDQSRSFRTYGDMPPYVRERELVMTREFARRLEALSAEQLNARIGQYISRDQIRAILKRRDSLLAKWAVIEGQ